LRETHANGGRASRRCACWRSDPFSLRSMASIRFSRRPASLLALAVALTAIPNLTAAQQAAPGQPRPGAARPALLPDAVEEAQTPRRVEERRPEQRKTDHDRSNLFAPTNAPHSTAALKEQPEAGEIRGFDFARDPLNAKKPMQTLE